MIDDHTWNELLNDLIIQDSLDDLCNDKAEAERQHKARRIIRERSEVGSKAITLQEFDD